MRKKEEEKYNIKTTKKGTKKTIYNYKNRQARQKKRLNKNVLGKSAKTNIICKTNQINKTSPNKFARQILNSE